MNISVLIGQIRVKLNVVLISLLLLCLNVECRKDNYFENLRLKKLPNGLLYAQFNFTIVDEQLSNDTRLFPRALGEILEAHKIHELLFSLTQGYWRLDSWGEPMVSAPTGAQVVAWFDNEKQDERTADKNWKGFTSRLSGLTCASLNFLNEKSSVVPHFAYAHNPIVANSDLVVRVGSLPKENVCTENLTPWSKLLPCGLSRGLASLLRTKEIFNSYYHSEGMHFVRGSNGVSLTMTLSLVLQPSTRLQPSDSFAKHFLKSVGIFPCQPASHTTVELWKDGDWQEYKGGVNQLKLENIPETEASSTQVAFVPTKYMGGYGQEFGTMVVQMENRLESVLKVLYVEVLPWYIRPYFHTMKIEIENSNASVSEVRGSKFHYTPGVDRQVLHKMEMDFIIPAKATVTLSFLVEKGHLKWNEYPPDANHGFYLEAAHFEVESDLFSGIRHYFSRVLLVNLSTPDFSMPYNVICLTCTVVALAFGPMHNITTKELKLSILTSKKDTIQNAVKWVKSKLFKKKDNEQESEVTEDAKSK